MPYALDNIGNRYIITLRGAPADRLSDRLMGDSTVADTDYVAPNTIPVSRMFQGSDPGSLNQDTGQIFVHLAFSSFVEKLSQLSDQTVLDAGHPLLMSEQAGANNGERRTALFAKIESLVDDYVMNVTITQPNGQENTYIYPMAGVGHYDNALSVGPYDDTDAPISDATNPSGQIAIQLRVQDRYPSGNAGSYAVADPLLKLIDGTDGFGTLPGIYESKKAPHIAGPNAITQLGTQYNGEFYDDNDDGEDLQFKAKVGFERTTKITRIRREFGAANHCDYHINIPNIVGYPEHNRCLVQVLQASFYGKSLFSENNMLVGDQTLPVMVGVEMTSVAPQNSFSSGVGRSRTGLEAATFGNTTMVGYGILQPFGAHAQSGTGGAALTDRVNQRLAYGFTSSRGILDEGVLVSSPFGSQVQVRFVNLTTHETLKTGASDGTITTDFDDIQRNPTHLVLRFLFLDDDEIPMR